MIEESVVELTQLMQGAALDPTRWVSALDAVNRFVEGAGVVLLSVAARQRFAPMSADLGGMMEDYFRGGWCLADRREACLPLLKARGVVVDHQFQTEEQIENCDFYQDFLARHRRKWFAGVSVEIDGDDWCLALQRGPESDPFGANDFAKLHLVRGALDHAASLSRQVGRSWMSGLQHAVDTLERPALVLDHRAGVLHVNDAAVAILGAHLGRHRAVFFDNSQTQATFDAMLNSALNPWAPGADRTSAQILEIGSRRYACRGTSLLAHEQLVASSAAALVVRTPLAESPNRIMRARYGLTDAEIGISIAIADGRSVEDIAAARGVKEGTIRAQLKSVYSKTSVNRQSRLVALVRDLIADMAEP